MVKWQLWVKLRACTSSLGRVQLWGYLRAMAELGAGPHRSGDIANELKREGTSLGPTRAQLIAKGMVWSPSHGDIAFTVPTEDSHSEPLEERRTGNAQG
jgi:hypothetical protein